MKLIRRALDKVFPTFLLRNTPTVRYAFSFLFLFAAVFGMAAVSGTKGSYVKIVPNQNRVELGADYSLDVFVYADTPINAVDVGVSFPDSQIEILGIDKGESVITLWTKEPYVENGVVFLQGGTYKRGFVGEHKIATINVKAKSVGDANFLMKQVVLLAGDGKGTVVDADTTKAKITTSVYKAGEEPTSIASANVSVIVVTDIDGDGAVSLRDISSFMASWSTRDASYDFNNDGQMTFRDFSILLADYFKK
jgi:hypothetical protein